MPKSLDLTAVGSGYYRVYVNGVEVSKHTSERQALVSAQREISKDPTAVVYYDHDYRVVVKWGDEITPVPEPEPEPSEPEPEPIPEPSEPPPEEPTEPEPDPTEPGPTPEPEPEPVPITQNSILNLRQTVDESGNRLSAYFNVAAAYTQSVRARCYINGVVTETRTINLVASTAAETRVTDNLNGTWAIEVHFWRNVSEGDLLKIELTPFTQAALGGSAGTTQSVSHTLEDAGGTFSYANVELPRAQVDIAMPSLVGAQVITVGESGDVGYDYTSLQAAFNAAAAARFSGPVHIKLKNGGVWTGSFSLPYGAGDNWILVEPETTTHLPSVGSFFKPSVHDPLDNQTPWILTDQGGSGAALKVVANKVSRWRFNGIGFGLVPGHNAVLTAIVRTDPTAPVDKTDMPDRLIWDRCWMYGRNWATENQKAISHGFYPHGSNIAVINSWIEKIEASGTETHAITVLGGPGPMFFDNNFCEASGINIFFGGGGTIVPNNLPEDITVTRNHTYKPLSWKPDDPSWDGVGRTVKNHFEIKHGRRFLVEGNVHENFWPGAQNDAINFKLGQANSQWFHDTCDVTYRYNRILNNYGNAVTFTQRYGSTNTSVYHTRRFYVAHNAWDERGAMAGISQLNGLLSDMNIIHNTFAARLGGSYTRVVQPPSSGNITLVMLDNLFAASSQGVKADGKTEGRASIEGAGLNVDWRGNLIVGRDSSLYGTYAATNQFPETDAALAYTDQDAGDYSLSGASPYKGDATDATDPGADWAALLAATAGVQR